MPASDGAGRCFTIEPGERWERVIAAGGLVLMRKVPPEPGVPPLYFRTEALPAGKAPIEDPGTTIRGRAEARRAEAGLEFGARPGPARPPARKLRAGGRAVTEILTETLPPLPEAQLPDAAGLASRSQVLAAEPPALPPLPPVGRQAVPAPAAVDAVIAPAAGPSLSLASARGYEVGFAITMILTVLLLAALVLLLRWLLRPPAVAEHGSPGGDPDMRAQPQAPIAPFLAGRIAAREGGRDALPPLSPHPGPLVRPWRAPALLGAVPGGVSAWQPATTRSAAAEFGVVAEQEVCAALLREAGWEANVRPGSDRRRADVVARRQGRVMVLRCLPPGSPVEEQDVEGTCVARERERADLAVVVCNAPSTPGARQLAARTGIEMLGDDELRAFLA